ncbi:MAG: bifunctional 5,10-methylenetetrahydrofolate dehydrogenase/5,10-methenyltetrahydrofolate cyclohydrolase [Candidatus Marinimicrobia bacterium]|jgi:methylenetetrahydrofolate dehydrogenase (NADP+)/methenyltetrahydrofolate cyclohydrolase|nr:bifunctional 5,10-methylenetetrahydrofolate dehydrogenase/5,10-methenyltetrahydrofolate cyclohydrolase [Candidatus Neomarinimicrobiota bacterium]MDP6593729.1 bifunctional 5,10-methylenetetrahydrofolate dehydrogenase/5,10-methenyltetrahydrofolate cyclohydrolase [Candidatus Neomarinimicrobiota bacterium]|tara:strand:- start:478 stop:1374 length:897 start_codon:yes stop_codon:yes gene_type:complete
MLDRIETQVLSGKEVAKDVYANLQTKVEEVKSNGTVPGLAAILVGEDPASQVYVRSKTRRFNKLGLHSETIRFPADIEEADLLAEIRRLNSDPLFHGILVQLPLPRELDSDKILYEVSPEKDVDGFHPVNLGRLAAGSPRFIPCTPKGILRILQYNEVATEGRHVVVVGRSTIVGRPMSLLLSLKTPTGNATTTICHSRTPDIGSFTRQADIVIAAVGVAQMITGDMIQPGAAIIDVGINRVADDSEKGYRLVGDVDFDSVQGIAGAVTPVPGGVGPMTIAMLVENTVEAALGFSIDD